MSSVRMCDNKQCRSLFSENDDGWSTDSRNVVRRKEDGGTYTVKMQIDLCASCVGTEGGTVTSPRLAEAAGALPRPGTSGLAAEITAAEAEDTRADVELLKLRMDEVEQRLGAPLQYHGPNCPGHTTGKPAAECITGLGGRM